VRQLTTNALCIITLAFNPGGCQHSRAQKVFRFDVILAKHPGYWPITKEICHYPVKTNER
jgi:hypothetical protein